MIDQATEQQSNKANDDVYEEILVGVTPTPTQSSKKQQHTSTTKSSADIWTLFDVYKDNNNKYGICKNCGHPVCTNQYNYYFPKVDQ